MTDTTNPILQRVIAARVAAGLILMFEVPGPEIFTCYPKNEADKRRWLARAEAKGWMRR